MNNVQKLARSGYTIDASALRRFDSRNDAFGQSPWEESSLGFDCHATSQQQGSQAMSAERCVAEMALATAAKCLEGHLKNHFCGIGAGQDKTETPKGPKYGPMEDAGLNTANVKMAAEKLGADLVGICRANRNWIFSHSRSGQEIELPPKYSWAVVMGIRMEPADIMDGDGPGAHMATMIGYMKMGVCVSAMSMFIRRLGYSAVAACNDTGLSIPLAVDAGLGEMGRHGLLITPEFGPCVRICKVFTDMPLKADKPVAFGVEGFCSNCRRCAEACQAGAISLDKKPSFRTACKCNNPGVQRWAVDVEKCFGFWYENGGSCSSCISACPFTMIGWERSDLPSSK